MIDLNCTNCNGEHLLNYDNHLEIALKKEKKPPPPDNTGKIIATITLTLTLTFTLEATGIINLVAPQPKYAHTDPPTPFHTPYVLQPGHPPLDSDESRPNVGGPGLGNLQIHSCYGHPSSANFRESPAHDDAAIKGTVPIGEWVYLTGETAVRDGIVWYEAVNYSPLAMSNNGYAASYQPQASQFGWIAACFVE
ncbi:MAG: hypothetical protein AAFX78_06655 [Cyanobacteria bacterium J06638_20]